MKTIMMGAEYAVEYETLVLSEKRATVARVWAMPNSVVLDEMHLNNDELTPDQADDLARALTKAAEDARHLHHPGKPEDDVTLLDDRPFRSPLRTRHYLYFGPFRIRVPRYVFAHSSRGGITNGGNR